MILAQCYDLIGFDLDGVIYRGPNAVPGAAHTIAELRRLGIKVGFVTNNAQRPPQVVVDQLTALGIPCVAADIVTSAQATARIMGESLPPGSQVLVLGTAALAAEIGHVGLIPVMQRTSKTAAIVMGFDPSLTWEALNEGCYAVQDGAQWYACNNDMTRPTDQGIAIGMGGALAAMSKALPGREPIMGGKPARALFDETRHRLGGAKPLFVGDRLDTDIEGAHNAGWDSLFVVSGSHTLADLDKATQAQRPTYVGGDVTALLRECDGVQATAASVPTVVGVAPEESS